MVQPTIHAYDAIIMNKSIKAQRPFFSKYIENQNPTPLCYAPIPPVPLSVTELEEAIRDAGYGKINWRTTKRHCIKLAKKGDLEEVSKEYRSTLPKEYRQHNETLYQLGLESLLQFGILVRIFAPELISDRPD
jgi:hypothetical protein